MASEQGKAVGSLLAVGGLAGEADGDLLDRFLAGPDGRGEAAFEALVARHGPMVLGVCRQVLGDADADAAHDAFQTTWLTLAQRAGTIRRRDSLPSWLFGVARRVSHRSRAQAARRRAGEQAHAIAEAAEARNGPDPTEVAILYEEIDRLPAIYRDPVVLCGLNGLTHESAAGQLGCPPGTLSVRLSRARARLRARLQRRGVTASAPLPLPGVIAGSGGAHPVVPLGLVRAVVRAGLAAGLSGRWPGLLRSIPPKGVTLLGGLGLAAATLAAAVALATRRPEAAPLAGPTLPNPGQTVRPGEPPSWVRTTPSGLAIELVAISAHATGAQGFVDPVAWRAPTGRLRDAAPSDGALPRSFTQDGEQSRVFVVRADHLRGAEPHFWWEVTPSRQRNTEPQRVIRQLGPEQSVALLDHSMIWAALPRERTTCTVRVGVATDGWTTVATAEPGGHWGHNEGKVQVTFGLPREVEGRAYLALMHRELPSDESRIVAVDQAGGEQRWWHSTTSVLDGCRFWELQYDRPLAEYRQFRLQIRPIEWVDFAEVPLEPAPERPQAAPGK